MFRLGVIEESLKDKNMLKMLRPYFYSQRIENVPEDEEPIWHTNEYHVEENNLIALIDELKDNLKDTWYIHAFDDQKLYVILQGKWFRISLYKDETWESMIKYGVEVGKVEYRFLESVPLHI